MDATGPVSELLDLAERYLETAELNLRHGNPVPAYNHALHALELAVKAAVVAGGGRHERTHNPAGAFGRLYRGRVADDTCAG